MDDYKLEKLKSSRQMAADGWIYGIQRMDLLIISISGAGVWVVLETLKYAHEKEMCDLRLVKIAGIIFVLAMIINFISQWTGKNSNFHHMLMCDEKILAGETPDESQQTKITKCDDRSGYWDNFPNLFNIGSMILMLLGLGIIMIYFLITF